METAPDSGVTVLGEDECWRLLETAEVGRLAVVLVGEPEIFPVNFVVDGRTLVFRTAEGTKLFALAASSWVAFESDGYHPDTGQPGASSSRARRDDSSIF